MTESMGTYTQLARAFVPKALGKVGQNVALTFPDFSRLFFISVDTFYLYELKW